MQQFTSCLLYVSVCSEGEQYKSGKNPAMEMCAMHVVTL